MTEWLRSSPGKRVGCNSLVGSSPMSSAKNLNLSEKLRFFYFQWFPVFSTASAILRIAFQNFKKQNSKNQYEFYNSIKLEPAAESILLSYFQKLYDNRDENFGNGRDVRNTFQSIFTKQSILSHLY